MLSKKSSYYIISFMVIVFVAGFFIVDTVYKSKIILFLTDKNKLRIVFLLVTAFLVHIVKSFRLYLAVYANGIDFRTYIRTYCKVTPVNMIVPYKLGEIFRIYCYAHMLGKGLKGTVTVLFDRFIDTVALLTIIVLTWIFQKEYIPNSIYLLLMGTIIVLIGFFIFPGIYCFWKDTFLKATASRKKNDMIRFLMLCNTVYREILDVIKGKGVILYFLSLLAWGIEVGGFLVFKTISGFNTTGETLSDYLMSSLGKTQTMTLKSFVLVSVVLLFLLYIGMTITFKFDERKRQNEHIGSI